MFRSIVFISIIALSALSNASAPLPNTCPATRQAKANVKVERLHWVQEQGSYKLKSDIVCQIQTNVGVHIGELYNCTYSILARCPIQLDGNNHNITVSGQIYHKAPLQAPNKYFIATYHLDRNSSEVKTGEASSAQAYTSDLSLKKIGLSIQSKIDSYVPGKTTRDGVFISVDFEDTDAP